MKKILIFVIMGICLVGCSKEDISMKKYVEADGNTVTYKFTGEEKVTKENYVKYRDLAIDKIEEDIKQYKLAYIYYNDELLTVIKVED